MQRNVWRTLALWAIVLSWATIAARPAGARNPTQLEQYYVELINAARRAPASQPGYPQIGGDLNEGPPTLGGEAYAIQPGPHQPLALNPALVDAAAFQADLLEADDEDFMCHTCVGFSPEVRMTLFDYVDSGSDFGPGGVAEITGLYGTTASDFAPLREVIDVTREFPQNGMIEDPAQAARDAVLGFFVDLASNVPSELRERRSSLLYGEWREIGVGIDVGGGLDPILGEFDGQYAVVNLANRSDQGPFITGVAFDDLDRDQFYTPDAGEALGGVTVEAYLAGTQSFVASTSTTASGGYNLEVPVGLYDVRFVGIGIDQTFRDVAVSLGPELVPENTKVDLPEPSGTLLGLTALAATTALGARRGLLPG